MMSAPSPPTSHASWATTSRPVRAGHFAAAQPATGTVSGGACLPFVAAPLRCDVTQPSCGTGRALPRSSGMSYGAPHLPIPERTYAPANGYGERQVAADLLHGSTALRHLGRQVSQRNHQTTANRARPVSVHNGATRAVRGKFAHRLDLLSRPVELLANVTQALDPAACLKHGSCSRARLRRSVITSHCANGRSVAPKEGLRSAPPIPKSASCVITHIC